VSGRKMIAARDARAAARKVIDKAYDRSCADGGRLRAARLR